MRSISSLRWNDAIFQTFGISVIVWVGCVAGVALIHHDINPELYESKFNKRELFWNLLKFAEWLTFKIADVVISTNESYRDIAIARGGLRPENVIVRSGPDLGRVKARAPNRHGAAGAVFSLVTWESFSRWLRGSNG